MTDAPALSIAELSEALGVPIPTIRSWERRYGLPAPIRTPGGHRRYTELDLRRFRALRNEIVRGRRAGDAARRIASAGGNPLPPASFEALIEAALRLDSRAVRDALETAADRLGVERALEEVALAGLREIGLRWETGRCDVGHEHVATQEVRNWIVRQQATAPQPYREGRVLLAGAPQDQHAIGTEAFAVVLARRGWACTVMGARTPVAVLRDAVDAIGPAAVVVTCQWTQARRSAIQAISAVARRAPTAYAGSAFTAPATRRRVRGRYLGDSLTAAADVLESLVAPAAQARRRSARS